ncbi:MAG: MFS transporter [Chloroflexi bacterium]|nr:MFS transporter [Chloroflexota bacterium]
MAGAVSLPSFPKVFYGWRIVAVTFVTELLVAGSTLWAFGAFIVPLSQATGWSVTAITAVATIRTAVTGALGPVIGPLFDRRNGSRVLMTVGCVVAGVGFVGAGLSRNLWQFYLALGVVGAFGNTVTAMLAASILVSRWFERQRGRAMALSQMGMSISGFVIVPLVQFLILTASWRWAWIVLGLACWAITPLVWLVVRGAPEEMGLLPDGGRGPLAVSRGRRPLPWLPLTLARQEPSQLSWTRSEAVRTRSMWLLVVGFGLGLACFVGLLVHLLPFLRLERFSPGAATALFTAFALGSTSARMIWGFLSDWIAPRYCAVVCFLGVSLAMSLILRAHSFPAAWGACFFFGTFSGAPGLLQSIVWADYYGRGHLGSIRGLVTPLNIASNATGPILASLLRDATGSYTLAFQVFIGVWCLSAVLLLFATQPHRIPKAAESNAI